MRQPQGENNIDVCFQSAPCVHVLLFNCVQSKPEDLTEFHKSDVFNDAGDFFFVFNVCCLFENERQ